MRFFRLCMPVVFAAVFGVMLSPGPVMAVENENYEVYLEKGIVELDGNNLDAAIDYLEQAEKISPDSTTVLFYLGQAYFRSGDINQGMAYFEKVYASEPDSEYGRAAKEYLDSAAKMAKGAKGAKKPYTLSLFTGPQFDSNVPLTPNSNRVRAFKGGKGDWNWIFFVKSGYTLPIPMVKGLAMNATYDFYQSLHFKVEQFDVQDHNLKLFPSYTWGPLTGQVAYNFRYTYLGGSGFERIHGASTKVRYQILPNLAAETYYTFEDKKFFDGSTARDAFNHKYSLDCYYYFLQDKGTVKLGYYHETENAIGRKWDFDGYGLIAGVSAQLPVWDIRLSADGEYQHRRYERSRSLDHADMRDRRNSNTRYTVSLSKQFDKRFGAVVAFTSQDSNSTFREFDYDRELVTMFLTANF